MSSPHTAGEGAVRDIDSDHRYRIAAVRSAGRPAFIPAGSPGNMRMEISAGRVTAVNAVTNPDKLEFMAARLA
jgi:hypothetical protein